MRKFGEKTLLVATHNRGKLEEISAMLAPYGVECLSNADTGLPEPEETGTTFVENARIKAHAAAQTTGLPALADDSGLEIDGLGGQPGVYTADWAETPAGRDFPMAMKRVHDALIAAGTARPWTARFRSTFVLAWPDGHDEVFEGRVEGQIIWPGRGDGGHGYDPIFQADGFSKTFGEMSGGEKNGISHRADAFRQFVAGCFA